MGVRLGEILSGLVPEFEEKMRVREEILNLSRKVTALSKQGVMAIHQGNLNEASSRLDEAKQILKHVEEKLSAHPDLRRESTYVACQEYAEARVYEAVVRGAGSPSPSELGIPAVPFVLGLADSIGELRRAAMDALMRRELDRAELFLRAMEEIYRELLPLEFYYSLAPELRRKVDVARHLIETTMGDIYTESRRSSLERTVLSLEKRLETRGS